MASVRLSLVMDMGVIAMFTEQLRGLLEAIMARGLLNLVMDTAQEQATTTEVPREFKDMDMEVIIRDLLSLDMDTAQELATTTEAPREFKDMAMEVTTRDLLNLDTTMVMDILMSTRTVTTTMDLMDMRLSMITRRDLLMLDMATVVKAISMSSGLILTTRLRFTTLKPTTMDMARGPLNLDMALLMSMLSKRIMVMDTQNPMNMATTSTRDLLKLDMNPMKVTKMFQTPHTPTMKSKCTTLTKHQIENVPDYTEINLHEPKLIV